MMIAFWTIVVFLIIWAVRSPAPAQRDQFSPIRILDERFARGEIDGEEYKERRRVLENDR
jgi:putative membrane protein